MVSIDDMPELFVSFDSKYKLSSCATQHFFFIICYVFVEEIFQILSILIFE